MTPEVASVTAIPSDQRRSKALTHGIVNEDKEGKRDQIELFASLDSFAIAGLVKNAWRRAKRAA